MTAIGSKTLRDFWLGRARTALVVAAVALGIAGFTAVLSAYAILTRELNRGYLETNPASASLKTDVVDDDLLREIAADPRIRDAERRRAVSGGIRAGPAQWRRLQLFAVEDYARMRIGKIHPEQGAWPPQRGEIWLERDAFGVARARIGQLVTVRASSSEEHTLWLAGSVHDVGRAQARMENIVYGYVTVATLADLGLAPTLDQLDFVAASLPNATSTRAIAAEIARTIERRGHPVLRVDVPEPGQHPHAAIMGLLLLAMAAFGLFILILSGVLVVNLTAAIMASQIRQIGVMKAIGASSGQIARIYLAQTALLGSAAVAIGFPAGLLGGRVLCRALAVFLNFDITSFAAPPWVYLCVAVVGIVCPLLSAAAPIRRGARISPAAALGDFGVSNVTFGQVRFERALGRLDRIDRRLSLSIRNSLRRRRRFLLTLGTLSAAGLFFLTALNVRASLVRTLDRLFGSRHFDLSMGLATLSPLESVESAVRETPGVTAYEGWITTEASLPGQHTETLAVPARTDAEAGSLHGNAALAGERVAVIALPDGTRMLSLDIAEGRALGPGDTDAIVINTAFAARNPERKVGRLLTLAMGPGETQWRIVGVAREPFSPPTAYVTRHLFDQRGHAGMVNSLRLAMRNGDAASIERTRAVLESNLAARNVAVSGSLSSAESRYAFDQHMLMIYVFLIIASVILGGVGGLGLATTMSLAVMERRREIGILRAIGATPAVIGWLTVFESVTIGLLSWGVAVMAAWPIGKVLGSLLIRSLSNSGLASSFDLAGIAIWLAVSVSIAIAASLVPAWNASRRPVAEALGYE